VFRGNNDGPKTDNAEKVINGHNGQTDNAGKGIKNGHNINGI
jgi:hypothetical protein